MKNSSTYEKRFKALLARMRKAYSPPPGPTELAEPVQELVWAILLEDAAEGTAKVGMSRLSGYFVDYNELRVSRPDEIVEALPNTLSDPRSRANRMLRALQVIFDKFDTLQIGELRDHGKREARSFIASIPEMTPFVEARVCLFALGIHAMPVDQVLMDLLRQYGAVHPETDPRDTQGFLERIVPAKDAVEVAMLLEAFRQDPARLGPPPKQKTRAAIGAAAQESAHEQDGARKSRPAKPRPRPTSSRKAPAARKSGGKKK
jgi:endonuclease III